LTARLGGVESTALVAGCGVITAGCSFTVTRATALEVPHSELAVAVYVTEFSGDT
jgi:hypothetical protein